MKDYTYEVRGVNDPIDGEVVRFHSKQEALEYSDEMKSLYPDNTVYMVEWDFDDEFGFDGAPTKTQEMQIRGPEVDANLADPTVPNSCDGDNPANYDEEGNFRLPTYDDGLDDDIAEEDTDEGLVGVEDIPVDENLDDSDDDIENENFVEDLFNALSTKRSEEVFPKGDLDLEAPHKDVPVVDCDVNPVITHSEDEKPLNENK